MTYGAAGYVVCRPTLEEAEGEVNRITDVRQSAQGYSNYRDWIDNTQLESRVSLEDYSVSNRGSGRDSSEPRSRSRSRS